MQQSKDKEIMAEEEKDEQKAIQKLQMNCKDAEEGTGWKATKK